MTYRYYIRVNDKFRVPQKQPNIDLRDTLTYGWRRKREPRIERSEIRGSRSRRRYLVRLCVEHRRGQSKWYELSKEMLPTPVSHPSLFWVYLMRDVILTSLAWQIKSYSMGWAGVLLRVGLIPFYTLRCMLARLFFIEMSYSAKTSHLAVELQYRTLQYSFSARMLGPLLATCSLLSSSLP